MNLDSKKQDKFEEEFCGSQRSRMTFFNLINLKKVVIFVLMLSRTLLKYM